MLSVQILTNHCHSLTDFPMLSNDPMWLKVRMQDIFSETKFHPYSPLSHCRHIFRNRISPLFTLISPTARISPSAIFSHHNFTLIQPYLTHSHIHTTTSPLFSIIPSTISPLFNLIPPAAIFSHCNFTLIQPFTIHRHITTLIQHIAFIPLQTYF